MKYVIGVGVEDMWAIPMNQHATPVEMIVSIAGDMGAPVDQQDPLATNAGQLLGSYRSCEAGPDNEIVESQTASIAARAGVSTVSGRASGACFRDEATISRFMAFQV